MQFLVCYCTAKVHATARSQSEIQGSLLEHPGWWTFFRRFRLLPAMARFMAALTACRISTPPAESHADASRSKTANLAAAAGPGDSQLALSVITVLPTNTYSSSKYACT